MDIDENLKVEYTKEDILNELRCIICSTVPSDPKQCIGCDSIICEKCILSSTSSLFKCPFRCKNPEYGNIKPKTRFLFERVFLNCEICMEKIKSLNYKNHLKKCGKNTETDLILPISNSMINADLMSVESKISEIQFDIEQNYQPIPNIQLPIIPKRSKSEMMVIIITGIILLVIQIFLVYVSLKILLFDKINGVKVFCYKDFELYICIFALGVSPTGVFTLGFIGVGIFGVNLIGITFLFGIGQFVAGIGYIPIGQFVLSFYKF